MTDTVISDVLGFLTEKRQEINPEYVRAGKPVYTLRNYADLTDLDAEVLLNGGSMNVAEKVPTIGKSGNLLRTPRTAYAVNVDIAFDNRVKLAKIKKGKTEEEVYIFVVDQRALLEQRTGHIYTDFVVGFVIGKGANGELEVKGTEQVSERDFINDFRSSFDPTLMEDIMDLINKYRLENGTQNVLTELKFT